MSAAAAVKEKPTLGRSLIKSLAANQSSGGQFNVRVLLNSLKARSPLYLAALHERDEPDADKRAARLFAALEELVSTVMKHGGFSPTHADNEWLRASLSGTLAPVVAEDWIQHGRTDSRRLAEIAFQLSSNDLAAAPEVYKDRTDQLALGFSRVAAISKAINTAVACFSSLQAHADKIISAIDQAVVFGFDHLAECCPDRGKTDDLIMRQALYRHAGDTMAAQLAAHAGRLKAQLTPMSRQDKVAYMKANGGMVPITPALDAFRAQFDMLVRETAVGFTMCLPVVSLGADGDSEDQGMTP